MGRPSRTGVAWAAANYAATLPSNADPPYNDDESSYGSIDSMPDLLQRPTTHDDESSCGSIDSIPVLLGGPSDIDDDELSCESDDTMPPLEPRPPPSSTSWPIHEELSRFLHPHTAYAASDADCTRVDAPVMAIAMNTILQAHDTIDDQPHFPLLLAKHNPGCFVNHVFDRLSPYHICCAFPKLVCPLPFVPNHSQP
jgi:hypothetical protein